LKGSALVPASRIDAAALPLPALPVNSPISNSPSTDKSPSLADPDSRQETRPTSNTRSQSPSATTVGKRAASSSPAASRMVLAGTSPSTNRAAAVAGVATNSRGWTKPGPPPVTYVPAHTVRRSFVRVYPGVGANGATRVVTYHYYLPTWMARIPHSSGV